MQNNKLIYLDYHATTPTDPRVVEAMLPYFSEKFGNPHARSYALAWDAESDVEKARGSIAKLINATPKEIIFTSGATEANNLAIKGVMEFYSQQGKNHLIVSQIEHKCVLSSAKYLSNQGFDVTFLPVQENGIISLTDLENAITDKTALVSIMAVSNEIGTIQPITEIGKLCRAKGVFFHTDAAQAVGKIPIDVNASNIDLLSLSGHKMYGPKGVGALYVRRRPRVRVLPQTHGGGQERNMRSGTLPTPLCVGLGKAAEIAMEEMATDAKRVKELTNLLKDTIQNALPKVVLNGDAENRVYNNLNLSFVGVEGESLLMGINSLIAISSGSACTSSSLEASYVLKAIGVADEIANSSIRFGLGKYNTADEVTTAANHIVNVVQKLRDMSPIWEMLEAGIDLNKVQWAEH